MIDIRIMVNGLFSIHTHTHTCTVTHAHTHPHTQERTQCLFLRCGGRWRLNLSCVCGKQLIIIKYHIKQSLSYVQRFNYNRSKLRISAGAHWGDYGPIESYKLSFRQWNWLTRINREMLMSGPRFAIGWLGWWWPRMGDIIKYTTHSTIKDRPDYSSGDPESWWQPYYQRSG